MQALAPIQSPIRPSSRKPATRFGVSGSFTAGMDRAFSFIQKTRTREMLVEDFFGMAFLRTFMDLMRQYFFKETDLNKRQLNFPAARERLFRETFSIITDNISGGVVAWLFANAATRLRKTPNFGNQFASNETLALFQKQLVPNSLTREAFLRNLAKLVADNPAQTEDVFKVLNQAVIVANQKTLPRFQPGYLLQWGPLKKWWQGRNAQKAAAAEVIKDAAVTIAKRFKADKTTLDVVIQGNTFPLNGLIEDAAAFTKFVGQKANGKGWCAKVAQNILEETAKVNRSRLGLGLGVALVSTLLVPYMNHILTRKMYKIDSYPGEKGLGTLKMVNEKEKKSFFEWHMPYLTESLKNKKWIPAFLTSIPVFLFFGVDTAKLSAGQWGKALLFGKGYFKKLASMLQFGKGFPFTTQQQMASCYAFLIFSRLVSARTENEFRERFVDSLVLGWTVWILATPLLKRAIAKCWDVNLLKKTADGATVLKSRLEIERLVHNVKGSSVGRLVLGTGSKSTLGKYILMSGFATLITMFVLGIVEPYIAIKWTEWRALKSRTKKLLTESEQAAERTGKAPAAVPNGVVSSSRVAPFSAMVPVWPVPGSSPLPWPMPSTQAQGYWASAR